MNEDFGDFIKFLRKKHSLTQKELGGKLNVSDKAVSKWEIGDSYPDISLLRKIADIFGLSVDELLSCKCHRSRFKVNHSKNLLLFNIAANLVLIIVVIVLILLMILTPSSSSSMLIAVTNETQFMFISLLIILGLTSLFCIYNGLYYSRMKRGVDTEKTVEL
jgi:transcriptional regulator with XRE-family HTH domain